MKTQWRTTKEVSKETGIRIDTLRYYERIGLIQGIQRAPNGHRRYRDDDVVWILFLKQLRATGMSIAKMLDFAELRRGGDVTSATRRHMLEAHRHEVERQIALRQEILTLIDAKIARHKEREKRLWEAPNDNPADPMAG